MTLWLNLIFSFLGALISYVLVTAILAYVIKSVKWTSVVHAIKYEVQLWRSIVNWYAKDFPKGPDRLEQYFEVLNSLQPTPFKVNSSLFPSAMYIDKPEDLQIILNHSNALEKADAYKFLDTLGADSMACVKVSEWKWRRRAMMPFFNTDKLGTYSRVMYEKSRLKAEELRTSADTGKVFDLWDSMSGLTCSMTTETLIGLDADSFYTESDRRRLIHDLQRLSEELMNRVLRLWLHPDVVYAVVRKFNGWSDLVESSYDFLAKVIRHRKKKVIEETEETTLSQANETLLDRLSTLYPTKDGHDVSPALIQDVGLMYSAGSETSATSNCFTLLMLAMNPHIQDQLCREIDQVLGPEDDEKPITAKHVESMPLLNRCIKESLRLYPIIPLFARRVTSTVKLSGGQIAEENTSVYVCPYHVHRKREFYDNPLIFDPDHFLPEKVQKRHPYSYLPFSAGPRGCIGHKYAMLSMKISVATIMRKYRFTTDMKMDDIEHGLEMVLRSAKGWKVKMYTRR